jgi:hypothetical protein
MCSKKVLVDCKAEAFECLGPLALKAIALVACVAVFAPLLAAFAAPFVG